MEARFKNCATEGIITSNQSAFEKSHFEPADGILGCIYPEYLPADNAHRKQHFYTTKEAFEFVSFGESCFVLFCLFCMEKSPSQSHTMQNPNNTMMGLGVRRQGFCP